METLLGKKPENYQQLVKRSLRLYRAAFIEVIPLAVLLAFIVFIPRLLSVVIGQEVFAYLMPLSRGYFWVLAIDLVSLIIFIALLWRMHCVIKHIEEKPQEDYAKGVRKFLSSFVASVIQNIIILALTLICRGIALIFLEYHLVFTHYEYWIAVLLILELIAIIYMLVLFVFYMPLIAIENKGILGSLARSMQLVWHFWFRTFLLQLTPWLCYLLLLLILKYGLGINFHIDFFDWTHHSLAVTIANIIIFSLFIPWFAAMLLTQLNDLEIRKKSVTRPK